MRVIIAGSRSFDDYQTLCNRLTVLYGVGAQAVSQVISGACLEGADQLGEKWAAENKIPTTLYPADWDQYGKAAGFIRNREMATLADVLVAFWDGSSPGTKNLIDCALKRGLETHVFMVEAAP